MFVPMAYGSSQARNWIPATVAVTRWSTSTHWTSRDRTDLWPSTATQAAAVRFLTYCTTAGTSAFHRSDSEWVLPLSPPQQGSHFWKDIYSKRGERERERGKGKREGRKEERWASFWDSELEKGKGFVFGGLQPGKGGGREVYCLESIFGSDFHLLFTCWVLIFCLCI